LKHEKALEDINKLLLKNSHHAAAILFKVRIFSASGSYNEALEVIGFGKIMIE
jgi:hypothetical protein